MTSLEQVIPCPGRALVSGARILLPSRRVHPNLCEGSEECAWILIFFPKELRAQVARKWDSEQRGCSASETCPGTQVSAPGRERRPSDERTSHSSVFSDCFDDLLKAVNPQSLICFPVLADCELLTARSLRHLTLTIHNFLPDTLVRFRLFCVRHVFHASPSEFHTNVE